MLGIKRCRHLISCLYVTFLAALLRSEGHTVEFVKAPDRNDVELVVHGETIFRCDIQDLQYGMFVF